MDPGRHVARLIGQLVELAADWHSGHEAAVGNQVVAIALRSREGFVLYRRQLYLLGAEDVGWLLPGRMLSGHDCRVLFGEDGLGQSSRRLGRGAFLGAEIHPEGTNGLARLEVVGSDGGAFGWTFPSLAMAEDLVKRLEEFGIVAGGSA